jgi:hypothetical protein
MNEVRFRAVLAGIAASCLLIWASPAFTQQPRFTLDFTGPSSVGGFPRTDVTWGAKARLATAGLEKNAEGAQGWSIGVEAVGNCVITSATTQATVGAPVRTGGLRQAGFELTELTSGARNNGAISIVALSFLFPITLPLRERPYDILGLEMLGVTPAQSGCEECVLRFRSGLFGSGRGVPLIVTHEEASFEPSTEEMVVRLCAVSCAPSETVLFRSASPDGGSSDAYNHGVQFKIGGDVFGSTRPVGDAGDQVEFCSFSRGYGGTEDSLLGLARASVAEFEVTAVVEAVDGQAGVEARNHSGTAIDPEAPVLAVFVEVTPNGITQLVSGVRGSHGSEFETFQGGPVSISLPVRLGVERVGDTMKTFYFQNGRRIDHLTLDFTGDDDVWFAALNVPEYWVGITHGAFPGTNGGSGTGGARFRDLRPVLQSSVRPPRLGRAVVNSFGSLTEETVLEISGTRLEDAEEVIVAGMLATIVERGPNLLRVAVPPTDVPLRGDIVVRTPGGTTRLPNSFFAYGGEFIRCDWSGDGTVDISDAIGLVNYLFLGAKASECLVSGDCNSDGNRDLSDVLKAVNYLFLGAPEPQAPYPDPGYGPDGESCIELPVITAISSQQIGPNQEFQIQGSGFSEIPEQNVVLLGDAQLRVLEASPTQLTVKSGMILTARFVPLAVLTEFDFGPLLRKDCPELVCLPTLIGPVAVNPALLVELLASNVPIAGTTDDKQEGERGLTFRLDPDQFDPTTTFTVTANVISPVLPGISPGGRRTDFRHTFSRSDLSFEAGVVEVARSLERALSGRGPLAELIVIPNPETGVVSVVPSELAIASAADFRIDGVISMYPTICRCGPDDLHPVNDERPFGWCRFEQMVEIQACSGLPAWEHYIPSSFVFTESDDLSGVPDPDDRSPSMKHVMYNLAAYCHIRKHGLWNRCDLEDLVDGGSTEIPPFPCDAWVLKSDFRHEDDFLANLPPGADADDYYSYVYSGDMERYYLTALHHTTKDQGDWYWLDAYPPWDVITATSSGAFERGIGGCGGTNVDATATIQASDFAEYFLCTNVTDLQPNSTGGVGGVGPTATENSAFCGNFEFSPECPDVFDGGGGSETCLSCHERASISFSGGSIELDFLYSLRDRSINPDAPSPCSSSSGPVDFDTQIQVIFNNECGCHTGGSMSGGLSLSAGVSYANIVNEPSDDVPGMDRIEPNSPSNSYLWRKLQNTHIAAGGSGVAMPQGSFPLDTVDLDTIEDWINEGANP